MDMSIKKLIGKAGKDILKTVAKKAIKKLVDDEDNNMKVGDTIMVTNTDGSRAKLKIISINGSLVQLSDGTVRDFSRN